MTEQTTDSRRPVRVAFYPPADTASPDVADMSDVVAAGLSRVRVLADQSPVEPWHAVDIQEADGSPWVSLRVSASLIAMLEQDARDNEKTFEDAFVAMLDAGLKSAAARVKAQD